MGWGKAFENYFPKYATSNGENNALDSEPCVKSFFTTNVPYNFVPDTDIPWTGHFLMLDGDVVVFKPREWRGTGNGVLGDIGDNYLSEEEMAAEINGYEKGSVAHLYLTGDGGMNLQTIYKMVDMLDGHVKIVNHEELTEMARQKSAVDKLQHN